MDRAWQRALACEARQRTHGRKRTRRARGGGKRRAHARGARAPGLWSGFGAREREARERTLHAVRALPTTRRTRTRMLAISGAGHAHHTILHGRAPRARCPRACWTAGAALAAAAAARAQAAAGCTISHDPSGDGGLGPPCFSVARQAATSAAARFAGCARTAAALTCFSSATQRPAASLLAKCTKAKAVPAGRSTSVTCAARAPQLQKVGSRAVAAARSARQRRGVVTRSAAARCQGACRACGGLRSGFGLARGVHGAGRRGGGGARLAKHLSRSLDGARVRLGRQVQHQRRVAGAQVQPSRQGILEKVAVLRFGARVRPVRLPPHLRQPGGGHLGAVAGQVRQRARRLRLMRLGQSHGAGRGVTICRRRGGPRHRCSNLRRSALVPPPRARLRVLLLPASWHNAVRHSIRVGAAGARRCEETRVR